MTLSTERNRNDYDAGGAEYDYTFKIFAASDLTVIVTDNAGVPTTKVLTADYSVSNVGEDGGGRVTFVVAPTTGTVAIIGSIPLTQTTDLVNETGFFQDRIETALDRTVRMAQVAKEIGERGLRLPEGEADEPGSDLLTVLPPLATRKGQTLAFDAATGHPTTVATATSAISDVMQAVVQSSPLSSARAAMGPWEDIVLTPTGGTIPRELGDVAALVADDNGRMRATYLLVGGGANPTGAASRDAVIVSRSVVGATDCHAFADSTVMDSVSDAGTYGTFDATTVLRGSHTQNHVYAFQDRIDYQGSGVLSDSTGFLCYMKHSGSGTITERHGLDVRDVTKTGGGAISQNIGVRVRNLSSGSNNVALNIEQSTGYSFYMAGGAKGYHKGVLSIGAVDDTADAVALTVRGSNLTGPRAFLNSSASNVQAGLIGGDFAYQVITNGAVRLEVTPSSGSYTVRPGADNTQPLGDVTKRWHTVYAGTGTINTSDEREKQQIRALSAAERSVAIRLKGLIRAYKFNDAVAAKGDKARIHVGVIAQDVQAAFATEGLNGMDYAVLCFDEWPAECRTNEQGEQVIDRPAGSRWGVRYDELFAFILGAM